MTDSKICIALDFKNKVEVKKFLEKFEDEKLYVKVGNGAFLWRRTSKWLR